MRFDINLKELGEYEYTDEDIFTQGGWKFVVEDLENKIKYLDYIYNKIDGYVDIDVYQLGDAINILQLLQHKIQKKLG